MSTRPVRTAYDSPALSYRSHLYPRLGFGAQEERVPFRVRATKEVRGGVAAGDVVECWVNSHGAVSAILPEGMLGLKPGEFEVVEWHPTDAAGEREEAAAWFDEAAERRAASERMHRDHADAEEITAIRDLALRAADAARDDVRRARLAAQALRA